MLDSLRLPVFSRPRFSSPPLVLIATCSLFLTLSTSVLHATPISGGGDGGGNPGGGSGNNPPVTKPATAPGPAYSWEGSVGTTKTGNGNHLTSIPIVFYKQLGGLPVELTLNQNSQSSRNGELGPKWSCTFDTSVKTDASGNVTIYWGDGRVYTFTKTSVSGTTIYFTAPSGIHDTLIGDTGGTYLLKTHDQVSYKFSVYSGWQLAGVSDENSDTMSFTSSNHAGYITQVQDAAYHNTIIGYDANNRMISITDPLNRKWTLSYDANGNLAHIYWPVINGTTYSINIGYDANHNITSYQDLRGNTSTAAYNADNSIAWEKDNAGNQTTFQYGVDAGGNANAMDTTIIDPNGHKTVHTYNSSGQLASVTDALGYTEYYSYDSANNVTQKQDRRGYYWNSTYDGMGNVLTAKDPYGNTTTYTYNAHNKMLTQTWPSSRSIANAYDSLDNLIQTQQKDAAGNVKATTTLTIGSYGLVSAKTDANGHKTLYTYDANGYLASTTTPLGHQTQWTYDALGFQTSRIDAMSRTTTYTPDAWERNVTTTYPDGTTNTYGYDANSNLTAFANYAASFTRTYDNDNRLLAEYFSGYRHYSHTYDAPGQKGLLSTVTDYDGRVISYAYSARNELTSVGDSQGTATYQYDADGNQSHLYNPNGTRTDQYYNADNTLDSYYNWNGQSTIFQSFGYAYNADHQITSENEGTSANVHATANTTQTNYGYDAQGHLTTESRTGSNPLSYVYGYDPQGNRTNFNNGADNPYTYDSDDEPTGAGGVNTFVMGYNANGDRTSESFNGQVTTFGYDYDDQLTSFSKSGTSVSYAYDALGRQLSKSVNGALTVYYFDGDQILLEKQGGVNTAQYLWGNGLVRCNGEYPLTDGRVNVRLTTNASQQVTSSNQPDAFGIGSVTAGTASAYAYGGAAGYREDGIAPAGLSSVYGFQKVGARYYDPTFGAFLTRDTDLSQSPYAYCDGDPVNFTDPTGHSKNWWQTFWSNVAKFFSSGGVSVTYQGGSSSTTVTTIDKGIHDTYNNGHGGGQQLNHGGGSSSTTTTTHTGPTLTFKTGKD